MNWMRKRLVEMIDYALADKDGEELLIEVNIFGAAYQQDERSDLEVDENPQGMFNERYLGDKGMFVSEEFSTTDEWKSWDAEQISRDDLIELRNLIAGCHQTALGA